MSEEQADTATEEQTEENNTQKILGIALTEDVRDFIKESFPQAEFDLVDSEEAFADMWGDLADSQYAFVLCGSSLGIAFPLEVGQLVSNECPETALFFAGNATASIRIEELQKNGFRQIFLYPLDKDEMITDLSAALGQSSIHGNLRAVEILQLDAKTQLSFDVFVFLPLNEKYVKFNRKGEGIGEKRFQRLKTKEVSTLFVQYQELADFAKHTATLLENMEDDAKKGSASSREKLRVAVRSLILGVFDNSEGSFENGKVAMDTCKKIVSAYVSAGQDSNIFKNFAMAAGGLSCHYGHSTATSIFATLLAMGVGYPSPEDLSIAGFFHDLSLWNADEEIRTRTLEGDEKKDYDSHPARSLDLLKAKKMALSDEAIKIVTQHHERFDGKGFPKELKGDRICEGAQILSFADQMEYLTSYQTGKKKFDVQEAIDKICNNGSISPTLQGKIKRLFEDSKLQEAKEQKAA